MALTLFELYDRKEVHDIFERADKMMYERKKQLKEMGSKSRD